MTDNFPEESPLDKAQKHLAALETFMRGPAYVGFQYGVSKEIEGVNYDLLEQPVKDICGLVSLFELRGARRVLIESSQRFEDARVALTAKIDEMVDQENQNTTRKV